MDTNTVTGRVAHVNERGLKLEGADQWANVSCFAVGVVMPARGQQVVLTLDGKGFIHGIALATTNGHQAPANAPQAALEPLPAVGKGAKSSPAMVEDSAPQSKAPAWPPPWEGTAEQQPGTQRIISRQAVLNTATAILSSGGRAISDPAEVVKLAAKLEQWVFRPAK